jgi:hypothetical protein
MANTIQVWKIFLAALWTGLVCLGTTLQAAISVGPTGSGPLPFGALPAVTEWATVSLAGNDAAITTAAQMDAAVQATTAAMINNAVLDFSPTNPPAQNVLASWTSGGSAYLQTRPTGNGGTLLMATLQNATGASANRITLAYTLGCGTGGTAEQLPGHRVYYSTTGAANGWVRIPQLDNTVVAAGATTNLSVTVDLAGMWPAAGTLYLVWADDNATGGTDAGYTIDDAAFTATNVVAPVSILTEPSPVIALTNMSATFSVVASGTIPSYFWFKFPATFLSAAGPSYTIASVQASDAGSYFVIVSNTINAVTSTVVSLTVTQQNGWVAFNNQAVPPANVSSYSPAGAPLAGPLTNVLSGNRLPAYLTITTNPGAATTSTAMSAPPAGTPAYNLFSAHAVWTGGNCGILLYTTGVVTYVFTGLDSAKTYKFTATAVRGGSGSNYTNRWTQAELSGVVSYTTNHSAGVITSNQFPAFLTGSQAALNTGVNTTSATGTPTGDVFEWDNIVPTTGPGNSPTNGTFSVVTRQYTNGTPDWPAGLPGPPTYAYGLGQIRLEETASSGPKLTMVEDTANNRLVLSWPGTGFKLQQVVEVQGAGTAWADVPGNPPSPYIITPIPTLPANPRRFFRLVTAP